MKGTIKRIHRDKQFGFIKGEDNREYFFHKSALRNCEFDSLEESQTCEFEDSVAEKGPRAEEIYVD